MMPDNCTVANFLSASACIGASSQGEWVPDYVD